MSEGTTVTIHGLRELSQALQGLPEKLAGKILGDAVKGAATLVQKTAQENARAIFHDPTGATIKSIVAYRKKGSTPKDMTYEVGVTKKKRWPSRSARASSGVMGRFGSKHWPAFWWIYTEFGARPHAIEGKKTRMLGTPGHPVTKVNHPGIAARPWLRPAWTTTAGPAMAYIKNFLTRAISIAVAQLPKYTGGG